ncbi:MAG: flavin reductase family protein [Alphaproteobacteria bacterium]|nr:flavin reductase family protein [Alphaproteobacteria bacterium]
MTLNFRGFRDALGHFATGVAVISVRGDAGEPVGLTINSFASVSLEPPLILWSLDRSSDRFAVFMKAEHFAVNVLGSAERNLSQRLSRKGAFDLSGEALRDGVHSVPILRNAIATFECRREHRHDGGDHVIFVGRVLDYGNSTSSDPLIFYRGGYRELS